MEKKILAVILMVCMLFAVGCGGNSDDVGDDWRVQKGYIVSDWSTPDDYATIYIEVCDDGIRLIKDQDEYAVWNEFEAIDGAFADKSLVESTIGFFDVDGDECMDLSFTDLVNGQEMDFIYLYDADRDTFVYSIQEWLHNVTPEGVTPDYTRYLGTWERDGERIEIRDDYTAIGYDSNGNQAFTAYIVTSSFTGNDGLEIWYDLIDDATQETRISIFESGTEKPTDFYSSMDLNQHYIKVN